MNQLPKQLLKRQEQQRQTSVNQVLRAIQDLKAEGYEIKIKDLMDYTGLSRAVFAKPHIREVLTQANIIKGNLAEKMPVAEVKRAITHSKLKKKLEQKDERIQKLKAENDELKETCALLRGRLYLLMQLELKK